MESPPDDLEVERHRPERWWDTAVVGSVCCSCCCCCCCCVHSVGAAAGAVAGSVRSLAKSTADPEARSGTVSATLAYWAGVALVTLASIVFACMIEETLVMLLVLVMLAPALQLFGSFFALPAILLQPTPARRRAAAGAIWSATAGSFLGGLLGGLLMAFGGAIVAFVWSLV